MSNIFDNRAAYPLKCPPKVETASDKPSRENNCSCVQHWLGVQFLFPGGPIMQSTYRQLYRPRPVRAPAWLRRIWIWL